MTRSTRTTVVALVVAAAVMLVAGVVGWVLVRSDPEPAEPPWSIATEPGAVVVQIARSQDAAGLERALSGVGVAAEVDFLAPGQRCRPDRYDAADVVRRSRTTVEVGTDVTMTLDRDDLGPGRTLVLEVSLGDGAPSASLGLATGPVAPCSPEQE